jgi:hypothetical protein
MKAICTTYNKTKKGLILRNNWIDEIREFYHLNDYLRNYLEREETDYVTNSLKQKEDFKISHIIEGQTELDDVVIHIRIIS